MLLDDDIAALRLRIATAESRRDACRRSGMQEKYLEADSLVLDLAAQLERLELIAEILISYDGRYYHYDGRRFHYLAEALQYARVHRPAPGSDAPMPQASAVENPDPARAEGLYYLGPYRYDRLADGLHYAGVQKDRKPPE